VRSRPGLGAALVGLVALAGLALWLAPPGALRRAPSGPAPSVAEALSGGPVEGFARATAPRPIEFPRDHGPHPEYRTEWWYYTGNLRAADGRDVGFQLTFFRSALSPDAPARTSAWAASQVYLAHFAVTDVRAGRFHAWSRAGRGALDLAGARAEPYRVWIDTWAAEAAGIASPSVRLRAAEDGVAIDLVLEPGKPPVLQGDAGLSRKGPEPGNASYYYSLTRMPARGTVELGGERLPVQGLAWMDHEWSTSALSPDLAGWDWFALQLDDGRDVMLYRLRRRDGGASPWSAGSVVEANGQARTLAADDVRVEALGRWTSSRTGATYPAGWRIAWPAGDLVLELAPRLPDQELDVGFRYWEGAVTLRGTARGRPVSGWGYVELVGYERASGRDSRPGGSVSGASASP
jgi:predicted secreted hydrolase